MEAIVVDTEKTARKCIQILKERMLEPETFLPLDYIQAKPLKERLRLSSFANIVIISIFTIFIIIIHFQRY